MADALKPVLVASRCLEFAACRYNGLMISSDCVRSLKAHVHFIPVCPEVEIGLGVPRDPIRIVEGTAGMRLLQPSTRADLTERMMRFAEGFLGSLRDVDGFILKGRSPSCGIKDVKVFRDLEAGVPSGKGAGFFGAAVLAKFPGYPVEDEGRLLAFRIREHFLTSVWALARFREARARLAMRDLVDYQARNKLLLMAASQKEMRILGGLVANPSGKPARALFDEYEGHLRAAFSKAPTRVANINVLMHALGYFKGGLSAAEKRHFLGALEKYRAGKAPLSACIAVVNSWLARFGNEYLARQTFFEPYPEALLEITDSGKGRDL